MTTSGVPVGVPVGGTSVKVGVVVGGARVNVGVKVMTGGMEVFVGVEVMGTLVGPTTSIWTNRLSPKARPLLLNNCQVPRYCPGLDGAVRFT